MKLGRLTLVAGAIALLASASCGGDETGTGGGTTTSGTGGTGGTGGIGGTGTGGTGTGGIGGGQGGQGGQACVDPVDGPPTVTSATPVSLAPNVAKGSYTLIFSEDVTDVAANLTWSGAGQMDGVTQTDAHTYEVAFSGLAAGDTATLTVGAGVIDTCTNPLSEIPIDFTVLDKCHLLAQDFEGDWVGAGWSAIDNGTTGNVWDTNDNLGGTNHTNGSGLCISADSDAVCSGAWDTELHAPVTSLSTAANVVLSYQGRFRDWLGAGEAWLEASADGTTWTIMQNWTNDHGPTLETVDLSAYVGGDLYLRWRYTDDGDGCAYYWSVDDVCLESFAVPACDCPPNAYAESADVDGGADGNGTLATAETTGGTLTNVADTVSVCGLLEDSAASGVDYFAFDVGGTSGDFYGVTVDFCLPEIFETATIEIRDAGDVVVATASAADQGGLSAGLWGGATYYLVLSAPDGYPATSYTATVTAQNIANTVAWSESFEAWPPTNLPTVTNNLTAAWTQETASLHPSGFAPTDGANLARFNSWTASATDTATMDSANIDLSTVNTATLLFDMLHDTAYQSSVDTLQLQYDDGGGWTDIGPVFQRPGSSDGWVTEMISLDALAGKATLSLRVLATSGYGNDIYIDNMILLTD